MSVRENKVLAPPWQVIASVLRDLGVSPATAEGMAVAITHRIIREYLAPECPPLLLWSQDGQLAWKHAGQEARR